MTDNKLIIRFNPHPGTVDENIQQVHEQVSQWLESFPKDLSECTENDIASMKSDCASLRAGKETIEAERKRIKKEYLKPLEEFEAKVKPITKEIDSAIATYKTKLDEYEQIRRENKRAEIEKWWNEHRPQIYKIDISKVWDERYLNKTGIGETWQKDLQSKIDRINSDLNVIASIICADVDKGNFISAEYVDNVDLSKCLADWDAHVERLRQAEELRAKAEADRQAREAERQAREKARLEAQEREKQKDEEVTAEPVNVAQEPQNVANQPEYEEQEPENGTYWAEFRIDNATLDQMKALTAFIKNNNMHMTILKDEYGNPRKGH